MRLKSLLNGCLIASLLGAMILPAAGLAGEKELPFPAYGTGPIEVRIYSDYFCPPCRLVEPLIEPLLVNLLKNDAIRLTIVDTPYHQYTPLYARYFLFALKAKNDFEHALNVRSVLFHISRVEEKTPERLEALLKERGIPFASFDPKPVYDRYNGLLKEDKINATPTLVIIRDGKKGKWVGGQDIIRELERLPGAKPASGGQPGDQERR